jgi:hypothetical protein
MKLLLANALCMVLCLGAFAQDKPSGTPLLPIDSSTRLVTYSGTVKVHNAQEITFNRAVEWLDTAFRYSASEMRIEDLVAGKIVCKESLLDTVNRFAYATLTFTVSFKIEANVCQYEFTNLYIDRVAAGGFPNVPVELMMHATRTQYDSWIGTVSVGGFQGILDHYLQPIDALMQGRVASLRQAMTR